MLYISQKCKQRYLVASRCHDFTFALDFRHTAKLYQVLTPPERRAHMNQRFDVSRRNLKEIVLSLFTTASG